MCEYINAKTLKGSLDGVKKAIDEIKKKQTVI